ncbi:alpha/beta fold hydrolase [Chelatococcus reniformis]|uniref:Alpha/beta hydrolase n=1 Tax=Chelatococcus reniformis TaxID=1494448 RepID=A0A916U5J8_9HYPH|nr:alpha/beta hydrolase [Chelatococcus reniformis]GGC60669.1 alpha/beta hydrolase [Chelatococcus reniformis]
MSTRVPDRRAARIIGTAAAVVAMSAVVHAWLARRAERRHPPVGRFITVGGVRLHYVECGTGQPLVLLHGNGAMLADFAASGLLDLAAARYRVVAFDRPGFGHSTRPRGRIWTAAAQAELIAAALRELGIERAIVLGHSWGASVAIRLALAHPPLVRSLVLACGYYYPTFRPDALGASIPAVPIVGDVLSASVVPVLCRVLWRSIVGRIFGQVTVPATFAAFPKELALRPSQLHAMAAESFLVIQAAAAARRRYGGLAVPVVIVAGEGDLLVGVDSHAVRLHHDVPGSRLRRLPGAGHMVHHTATAQVMAAIDEAAGMAAAQRGLAGCGGAGPDRGTRA